MSFVDRVVLVTGASAGIGAAIAESFAGEGANVVLVGRDESRLNDVANLCQVKNSKCNTQVIRADISIDEDAKKIIDEAVSNFGRLDVLVNNAGIGKFGCLLDGKIMESFDQVMRINLRAHVYITSLAAPYLIKTKGNVINISSVAGSSVPPKTVYISYYLSKAALDHFTRCAAAELAAHNVRVNTISPGPVNTDITAKIANSDASDTLKTMMDQVTEPKEVADLVMFLASDKGKSITGANYIMDSGCLLVNH